VVQFGDQAPVDAFVVAEFDDTLNIDGSGNVKTTWHAGDEIWFWVQHDASVRIAHIKPTGGSGDIVDCGWSHRSKTQELTWPDVETINELSYIPSAAITLKWYGTPGEGLAVSGRSISIAGSAPCTCDATIPMGVRLYRFIPPALALSGDADIYRVVIYIYMESA
jgi:hypothetical protein